MATKQRTAEKYILKLHPWMFMKGDLVWRMASTTRKKDDKFSAIGYVKI